MTFFIADVASYQGDLKPEDVKRAGFHAVNLKISHGLTRKSVHPAIAWWIAECRRLKLELSTFHYLTADASGRDQADFAYSLLKLHGLDQGTAHQLDVECSPLPKEAEVRAYLLRMQQLLGRPVVLYSGAWWWRPRGWDVSGLAPHYWSAPNAGYLGSYPGDISEYWDAGYGGWAELSVMQYAVSPLSFPDGTRGTIKVSKSAVRDPEVWRALTEGEKVPEPWILVPCLVKLRDEFNAAGPKRDRASDGTIGDVAHEERSSDHNRDESGKVPIRDTDKVNEVHAVDIDKDGPWLAGLTMEKMVQHILSRCRSGVENRLRYIIFNKRMWHIDRGWKLEKYSGANPHDKHAHFSASYATALEYDTRSWHLEDLLPKEPPPVSTNDDWRTADLNPDPKVTTSAGGAVWTAFLRTGILNQLPGQVRELGEELGERVQDVDDELDGISATLVVLAAALADQSKKIDNVLELLEAPPAES